MTSVMQNTLRMFEPDIADIFLDVLPAARKHDRARVGCRFLTLGAAAVRKILALPHRARRRG